VLAPPVAIERILLALFQPGHVLHFQDRLQQPGVGGLFGLDVVPFGFRLPPDMAVGVDPGVVPPIATGSVQLQQRRFIGHAPKGATILLCILCKAARLTLSWRQCGHCQMCALVLGRISQKRANSLAPS